MRVKPFFHRRSQAEVFMRRTFCVGSVVYRGSLRSGRISLHGTLIPGSRVRKGGGSIGRQSQQIIIQWRIHVVNNCEGFINDVGNVLSGWSRWHWTKRTWNWGTRPWDSQGRNSQVLMQKGILQWLHGRTAGRIASHGAIVVNDKEGLRLWSLFAKGGEKWNYEDSAAMSGHHSSGLHRTLFFTNTLAQATNERLPRILAPRKTSNDHQSKMVPSLKEASDALLCYSHWEWPWRRMCWTFVRCCRCPHGLSISIEMYTNSPE